SPAASRPLAARPSWCRKVATMSTISAETWSPSWPPTKRRLAAGAAAGKREHSAKGTHEEMAATQIIDLQALAELLPDGAFVALPPDYSNVPMALTHALLRRGVRDLRLLCVP